MFYFASPLRGVQNRYWVNTIRFVYAISKIVEFEKTKVKNLENYDKANVKTIHAVILNEVNKK